jgi:BirA family transcriptional regulator, biotin operon repressor / biotin---[acetyl-CoA-carboxylase] ligase
VSVAPAGEPARGDGPPPLGRPRLHLRETDSTNARARALAIAGAPHGMLVTAAFQTAGRGRHGRRWSAPGGSSVLASILLRSPPPLLPLIAAVAVCDVVPDAAQIKWPNDVVLAREAPPGYAGAPPALAKLAGILIEGRPQEDWAVVGVGLNVALALEDLPAPLRATAATLGRPREQIEPTLAALLVALGVRLREPAAATLAAWRARDALTGREIAWERPGVDGAPARGRAAGIDGEGRLIVSLAAGGQITLQAGEVHLLGGA